MKVSELEGALLDYWVGRADGRIKLRTSHRETQALHIPDGSGGGVWVSYSPSADWAQGGPIIDQERISVKQPADGGAHAYFDGRNATVAGPTPLIAAMRAYVASKLGDEVGEVPPSDRTSFGVSA